MSGRTGEGISDLRGRLWDLVSEVDHVGDRPRLWVDRSFTVAGAGTVVTGTLVEGTLQVGDTVMVYPKATPARIRGLQSHETELERAEPGRRLAVNLGGVARAEAPRGAMIGLPDHWESTRRFTARLRLARYLERLPDKAAFHLHFGTGAHPARIRRAQDDLVLIETASPLPMRTGDRFILRDTGRRIVVAGGMVVDPAPGPARTALSRSRRIDPSSGADAVASALLTVRGREKIAVLRAHSGGGNPRESVVVGSSALTPTEFARIVAEAEGLVSEHHRRHPLREGIPLATLATKLRTDQMVVERVVEESSLLTRTGPDVARTDHQREPTQAQNDKWTATQAKLSESLAVPTVDQLDLDPDLLHLLIRDGRLVRVADNLVFLPSQIADIERILTGIEGEFTVAVFRDRTGLSRKYAVPLLEWSDRRGLTVRSGDLRRVR